MKAEYEIAVFADTQRNIHRNKRSYIKEGLSFDFMKLHYWDWYFMEQVTVVVLSYEPDENLIEITKL